MHSKEDTLNAEHRKRHPRDKSVGPRDSRLLLSGDIGGTKTILGLCAIGSEVPDPLLTEVFESSHYTCVESMIDKFLTKHAVVPRFASFAVAGPVLNGSAEVTNLPWVVDAARIRSRFGISDVLLLNDVEALGWAVSGLDDGKLTTLNQGERIEHGTVAVIAPGTGCGEASLVWNAGCYIALPSEGGHADFAPRDSQQIALLHFLQQEFDHVSVERVCSGTGLFHIYRFLREVRRVKEESWLAKQLATSTDPAPVISDAALTGSSKLCVTALELFAGILASEAGNLALRVLASGGVFIGGGIPPRILPFLKSPAFLDAFRRKGRLTSFLNKTPLHVVLDTYSVLNGCARHARNIFSP